MIRRATLMLALAPLVACASSSGAAVENADTGFAADDGTSATPACATVGKTICDVALQGYVSNETVGLASTKPASTTKLSAVLAAGTQKYALLYASAFWCSTCKQAGQQVVAQYPALAAKAMFVDVVIEGATPTTPTTTANLDAWIAGMKNPFSTLIDADPSTFAAKATLGIKETTYVVERATGKILIKTASPVDGLTQLGALP